MNTGHQPYTLARRSCTDQNWVSDSGCTDKCFDNDPTGGSSAFLATEDVKNKKFTYCCSQPVAASNGSLVCAKDKTPFQLETGQMMYDFAALENVTTAPKSFSNRDVAIGAGVGVPLGVIAATAIAWAIWERMQRSKQLKAVGGTVVGIPGAPGAGYGPIMKTDSYMPAIQNMPKMPKPPPVELENRSRIPKLPWSCRTDVE